jgi:hypothetical protein
VPPLNAAGVIANPRLSVILLSFATRLTADPGAVAGARG